MRHAGSFRVVIFHTHLMNQVKGACNTSQATMQTELNFECIKYLRNASVKPLNYWKSFGTAERLSQSIEFMPQDQASYIRDTVRRKYRS
jgi:hypothetical protein